MTEMTRRCSYNHEKKRQPQSLQAPVACFPDHGQTTGYPDTNDNVHNLYTTNSEAGGTRVGGQHGRGALIRP